MYIYIMEIQSEPDAQERYLITGDARYKDNVAKLLEDKGVVLVLYNSALKPSQF